MRHITVLFISLLALSNAVPLVPLDNSHYVEGESRYVWMPNDENVPVLVDLQAPLDEDLLRQTRNGANNQYRLFTRNNPTNHQVLTHGNANSIWSSNYHGGRATKVIVHGWNGGFNSQMNSVITSAFLAVGDVNVIVVDWSSLANSLYNTAVNGVPSVGSHLGNFINWLFNTAGGNFNQLHLVGFSLGAHVVGNAGRTLSGRPVRITGLDPAGPQWGGNSLALARNSGVYVEAIHTNGRAFGIMDAIAHADFYPNGGRNQPGCGLLGASCSHSRAWDLFASTIRHNRFQARSCVSLLQAENVSCTGNQVLMGNSILSKRASGLFGLSTGASWPY